MNARHGHIEYEVSRLTESGGWEWGISSLNVAGRAPTLEEAVARAKAIIDGRIETKTFPQLVVSEVG